MRSSHPRALGFANVDGDRRVCHAHPSYHLLRRRRVGSGQPLRCPARGAMPVADRGHTQIFWEEQGSGEPLLLVMGLGWPRQMWARHLPALTERFRVITFDNRGVGQTATTESQWSLSDMADDAVAVLDAAGVTQAHVYGASMGGGIAQVMTIEHPERVGALILGCTATRAANRRVPWWPVIRQLLPPFAPGVRRGRSRSHVRWYTGQRQTPR
jgi:pimeloyl-ACP methyl ester carboxylesterase